MTASSEATASISTEMAINAARIDFTSTVNSRSYRLLISEPSGDPPEGGWPVIYLIDGNLHFGIAVDTVRIQSRWPDTKAAVVVGIGYPTDSVLEALTVRNIDLTPPISQETLDSDWQRIMKQKSEAFGGMDAFLEMVEREVKPRVAAAVRINPMDQTLMGHSLGGLTTLAALLRTPNAYQTYAAISPSIWFSNTWVLQFVDPFIARLQAGEVRARLLLSAGEWESAFSTKPAYPARGLGFDAEHFAEMTRSCRIVENAEELYNRLEPLKGPNFDVRYVVHPDEDHRSVVPAGVARGVTYSLYRP